MMYSPATNGIIFLDNHRCFPFLGLVSRIPNFDSQLHPPRGPGYPVSRTITFGWRGRFQFLLPTCLVQLVLPDGKNSRDASGIVEPKLHRALFPSSRRDSGEGTRHSALKNAKDARTLLIWFRTLLYLFLSTEAWSSFSFFPPHRSPSLLPPPPHHLAGRHSFLPHRHQSSIRESAHRQLLKAPLPQEHRRISSDGRRWTVPFARAFTLSTVGPCPLCKLRYL